MCGIFGLLNCNLDFDFIKKEFEKGKGRGPEYSSITAVSQNTIFGFHRLAINGLNSESNQPIIKDNITLICNGEIYNYKELYKILGIQPDTQSDCEVIIHLYQKFGIERCLQLLDGVFAFILLDYDIESDNAKLYAARDPFGVRPLYFLDKNEKTDKSDMITTFGFASELKCLSEFKSRYNNKYTIQHILPGTYNSYSYKFRVSSYWEQTDYSKRYHIPSVIHMDYKKVVDYRTDIEEYIPIIQKSLVSAVEKRCLTTERPIACLLSGGLDSSLITALVNDYHIKNNLPTLETYSIGLKGSVDLKYARIVADSLGTKHTEIILEESDFIENIPEVIKAIESYDTTSVRASIGNYLLGKYIATNSEAKVIFNGDGSDELTGGYLYFHKAPNSIEFDLECRRLLGDIYMYDVLRSDKCISTHGLEPRTPFLDRSWVQTYLSIPVNIRNHSENSVCEKHLLRTAFNSYKNINGGRLLPSSVIWRTKEAFSDGVSDVKRSLFEIIQEHAGKYYLNSSVYNKSLKVYDFNKPHTLEQQYYRDLFEGFYPDNSNIIPYMWMPKFIEGASDASARTLKIYKDINKTD
jgi:asparagine synthase (glutamine-hydrolysing)